MPAVRRPRGGLLRYGVDAPYVPAGYAVAMVAAAVAGALVPRGQWLFAVAGIFLVQLAVFLHTTLRGKHRSWARLLERAGLQGDDTVLDVGCGRGAVLIAAAGHLEGGTAHGIDLWRGADQSGNALDRTRANAEAAGVAGRVELHTGDMTDLPFADAHFDLVCSSLAVHNLRGQDQRDRALDEVVRVLRPGGQLVLADIRHVRDYASHLRAGGAVTDVRARGLGPNMWFGGPWQATSVVTATRAP